MPTHLNQIKHILNHYKCLRRFSKRLVWKNDRKRSLFARSLRESFFLLPKEPFGQTPEAFVMIKDTCVRTQCYFPFRRDGTKKSEKEHSYLWVLQCDEGRSHYQTLISTLTFLLGALIWRLPFINFFAKFYSHCLCIFVAISLCKNEGLGRGAYCLIRFVWRTIE